MFQQINASSQSEHLSTFLHYNLEKLFVGKSVLYLFLYLLKATEIFFQLYVKCFNKVMNHNPENLLVVTEFYIYSFFLVKATEFGSQCCIKCFSKSSCMMLRLFLLRFMDFMISYRIRSGISVAPPQFSAQNGSNRNTIFF